MDNPEQSTSSSSSSSIQDYLAACTEVVRRKFGREVEMMVYVNKVIKSFPKRYPKSLGLGRLQSYGASNFEDDYIG